jgi:hypothetical protein
MYLVIKVYHCGLSCGAWPVCFPVNMTYQTEPTFYQLYLMDLSRFFSFSICTQLVGLFEWGISPSQGRHLHTEKHKHKINAHGHSCLSEIWTHDPSVRAGEDGSCLRPRGQSDRRAELPNLANPIIKTIYPSNYPSTPQLTPPKQVGLTWPVMLWSGEWVNEGE